MQSLSKRAVSGRRGDLAPRFTGCYETRSRSGFVTRARLQPGRKCRKMSAGFSPCCSGLATMNAIHEFRNGPFSVGSQARLQLTVKVTLTVCEMPVELTVTGMV